MSILRFFCPLGVTYCTNGCDTFCSNTVLISSGCYISSSSNAAEPGVTPGKEAGCTETECVRL